jgi:hypothetical protein
MSEPRTAPFDIEAIQAAAVSLRDSLFGVPTPEPWYRVWYWMGRAARWVSRETVGAFRKGWRAG